MIEESMRLNQRGLKLFADEGTFVELKIKSGATKPVLVRADGCITYEHYEEFGIRAEKYGPPRFASEDIESWGYYETVRRPTLRHPFGKVKEWRVRVWADGRLGEAR